MLWFRRSLRAAEGPLPFRLPPPWRPAPRVTSVAPGVIPWSTIVAPLRMWRPPLSRTPTPLARGCSRRRWPGVLAHTLTVVAPHGRRKGRAASAAPVAVCRAAAAAAPAAVAASAAAAAAGARAPPLPAALRDPPGLCRRRCPSSAWLRRCRLRRPSRLPPEPDERGPLPVAPGLPRVGPPHPAPPFPWSSSRLYRRSRSSFHSASVQPRVASPAPAAFAAAAAASPGSAPPGAARFRRRRLRSLSAVARCTLAAGAAAAALTARRAAPLPPAPPLFLPACFFGLKQPSKHMSSRSRSNRGSAPPGACSSSALCSCACLCSQSLSLPDSDPLPLVLLPP
jgi:hypothetical protein